VKIVSIILGIKKSSNLYLAILLDKLENYKEFPIVTCICLFINIYRFISSYQYEVIILKFFSYLPFLFINY